jgi:hypothetical protein
MEEQPMSVGAYNRNLSKQQQSARLREKRPALGLDSRDIPGELAGLPTPMTGDNERKIIASLDDLEEQHEVAELVQHHAKGWRLA